MRKLLLVLVALFCASPASAQVLGGGSLTGGVSPVTGTCTSGYVLFNNAGILGCQAASAASLSIGGSITGGTAGYGLYVSGSALGQFAYGTGVFSGLQASLNASGGLVGFSGALGTPTSGVLTNATGLPLASGVTGLLPVANGGTGTTTPGIVAGTNVTVSGTWPNQTVNASGGSGSGTVSSGTTNTLAFYAASGTTVSPLTLGTNLSITGTTLNASGSGGGTPGGSSGDIQVNSSGSFGGLTPGSGVATALGSALNGSGAISATTSPAFVTPNLGTPSAATLTNATGLPLTSGVTGLLPIANGGTGTASPGIVAGTNVTVSGSWPNQTVNSTASGGGVNAGTTNTLAFYASNGSTVSPLTLGTNLSITGTTLNAAGGGGGTLTPGTTATSGGAAGQIMYDSGSLLQESSSLVFTPSVSGSAITPGISIAQTWNTTGNVDAGILLNITNTASGASSKLIDLQIGGATYFNVNKSGQVVSYYNGGISVPQITSTTDLTSGVSPRSSEVDFIVNGSRAGYFSTGPFMLTGGIQIGTTGSYGISSDTLLFRDAAGVLADRNGTGAQAYRVYNAYTSSAAYDFASIVAGQTGGLEACPSATLCIGTYTAGTSGGTPMTKLGFYVGNVLKGDYGVTNSGAWTFNGGGASPNYAALTINETNSSGYVNLVLLNASITTSSYVPLFGFGQSGGTADQAQFDFYYIASGNTSNSIGIHFTGNSQEMFSLTASGNSSVYGTSTASAHISNGSKPALTTGSCSGSSSTGGATAGTFVAATCTAGTYILSSMPTSTTGYACTAQDRTTPTDTVLQTASSTTSVTFTATTVASDVIQFQCLGY